MTISKGDMLPDATLLTWGADGPDSVKLSDKINGRKVVIFAVPAAFSRTCSAAHVPSFIRCAQGFAEKGVDEIICLSVNDPFVMKAWGESTGAVAAGITMLGDAESQFTKAIGMESTFAPHGLIDRSKRYSMLVEDGRVTIFNPEVNPGQCDISAGETLLDAME